MTFIQFCEKMTEEINNKAMMKGDSLITVNEVANMSVAISAYTATVCISQIAK